MVEMNSHSVSGKASVYAILAQLLQYPAADASLFAKSAIAVVTENYPAQAETFRRFAEIYAALDADAREEIYVSTFDVMPVCCLDIGFSVFGEDYKRGQFMAELTVRHRECGINTGTDLPDFLPHILRLLTRMDYAEAQALVTDILSVGLEKMRSGFAPGNPFMGVIETVQKILRQDYLAN
jgi:nitrate reductase delta subunit